MMQRILAAVALSVLPLSAAHASPDEACLAFEHEGVEQGQDVLLIPGLGSSPQVWDETAATLADRYTVHRITIPGFAETPLPSLPPHPSLPADIPSLTALRITDYLACRGARKPVLIGHSMGGLIALIAARDLPDTFERVIIVDALPFYPLIFDAQATVDSARPQAEAIAAMIRSTDNAQFAAMQRQTASMLASAAEDAERIAQWSIASDRDTFAHAVRDVMTTDLRPDLPKITTPVTIIYAQPPGMPAERADTLFTDAYAGLPHAALHPVANSRHFIMYDQPERLHSLVAATLHQP